MVCHHILYPIFVFNLQVKFLKQKNPSDKSCFGILLGQEIFQSGMIYKNDYIRPNQVCPKFVEGVDHCQQFLLCSSIVLLCFIQGFACIIDYMRFSIFSLAKYCSYSKITCITHHLKRQLPIGCSYYWCSGQMGLQLFKALLALFFPNKFSIFL